MADLLIELFSEEIPARMQSRAADDLKARVIEGLVSAGLTYASAAAFSTPRRLALHVEGLSSESPDLVEERKGPRTDAPDKAIEGFLRATGLMRDQLEVRDEKKGQVYFAVIRREGRPADQIVAEVLEATIRDFPWPKSMRWGNGSLRWVRPLHSIIALLSDEAGSRVIPMEVDGIMAGDSTEGHRFMAPGRISVRNFEDYEAKLKKAHVILRADARAETIREDAAQIAFARGLEVVEDRGLLAEVAGLVECPVVLMGDIGPEFLDLPPEVLQTSMREHQKFFSVRNPGSGRIEKYITVANRETADHGATILHGNGKVLSARLSDAKFFWENDLRVVSGRGRAGMADMAAPLAKVTFHNRLGSVADRIHRMAALAETIAPMVGADPATAREAAEIAKADLASEMVFEFPELQGVMGRYYALAAGLPEAVADAAETHYRPLGPSDAVPDSPVAISVALADKIDMLAGFWAIDERPTGSKDPFALRRAALGVIRIVLANRLSLPLRPLFHVAFETQAEDVRDGHAGGADSVAEALLAFFADRLKVYLRDEGIRHDAVDAALGEPLGDDILRLVGRATALQALLGGSDGENLLQGYRRAANILVAEEAKDGVEYSLDPQPGLAENDAERGLFVALDSAEGAISEALAAADYDAAMTALAGLRGPIDAFFEATLINAENQILRRNRLCLLNRIRRVMGATADFSRIEG